MALNISLVKPARTVASVEVPADVAADLQETYEALKEQSQAIWAEAPFDTAEDASAFASQARAWATENGVNFSRKGTVKDAPTVVTFRVYDPTGRKGGPGRKAAQ